VLRVLVEYDWPGNVRELRNLVESMVVLAPGRVIRPEDIPPEVRHKRTGSLLPVLAPRPVSRERTPGENGGPSPELEFVLRTLYDLRMNLEDLRRDVEEIRKRDQPVIALPAATGYAPYGQPVIPLGAPIVPPEPPQAEEEEGVVVFRRGMTLADMEREAIAVALRQARGNRRRAAEMLGMGERTLYRKLKEYEMEPGESA
jgi:DNA-binding NtrC family response regulator